MTSIQLYIFYYADHFYSQHIAQKKTQEKPKPNRMKGYDRILLSPRSTYFFSAPCSQTPSDLVLLSECETKFRTHTIQHVQLQTAYFKPAVPSCRGFIRHSTRLNEWL
jgi:hypothetical protein